MDVNKILLTMAFACLSLAFLILLELRLETSRWIMATTNEVAARPDLSPETKIYTMHKLEELTDKLSLPKLQ